MFKVDDYVIYNHDVCKINGFTCFRDREYYVLNSLSDSSLKINVPVDNKNIRGLITKEKIYDLINEIPSIQVVDVDSKNIDGIYKSLLDDVVMRV